MTAPLPGRFGPNVTVLYPPAVGDLQPTRVTEQPYEEDEADASEEPPMMDDKDVRHLEAQVAASEQRSQLRLEAVLARIDGKLDALSEKMASAKEQASSNRSWTQVNIAVVVTLFLATIGIMISLKQVWIGGVQVGQSLPHAADMSSSPQAIAPAQHP